MRRAAHYGIRLFGQVIDFSKIPHLDMDSFWIDSFGCFVTVINCLNCYREEMFPLFCFIGAVIVKSVCANFSDQIETLNKVNSEAIIFRHRNKALQSIQTSYLDLIAILESINEAFGNSIIIYFIYSFPVSVSMLLFDKNLDEHLAFLILNNLRYWEKIGRYILFAFLAAEGNSKVEGFKQWLLHTSFAKSTTSGQQNDDENQTEANSIHEDESPGLNRSTSVDLTIIKMLLLNTEGMGLKGYKFFTLTHGFIGSVREKLIISDSVVLIYFCSIVHFVYLQWLGLIVTYAIVMYQFEAAVEEKRN